MSKPAMKSEEAASCVDLDASLVG